MDWDKEKWLKLWGFVSGTPEAESAWREKEALSNRTRGGSLTVIRDIGEYVSPVDGSHITSRSQHRDHLRQHQLVELGNERVKRRDFEMPRMGHDIKAAIEQLKARA